MHARSMYSEPAEKNDRCLGYSSRLSGPVSGYSWNSRVSRSIFSRSSSNSRSSIFSSSPKELKNAGVNRSRISAGSNIVVFN